MPCGLTDNGRNTLLRGQGAGLPPYAQTQYDLTQPCTGTTTVMGNAWSWATDARYFWHTQALPQLLLPFSCVLLHASVIEYAGGAVLFSAPSGTGKSTQAALWARHRGAHIRNGDKAGVRVLPDSVRAYGVSSNWIVKNQSRSFTLKRPVLPER